MHFSTLDKLLLDSWKNLLSYVLPAGFRSRENEGIWIKLEGLGDEDWAVVFDVRLEGQKV